MIRFSLLFIGLLQFANFSYADAEYAQIAEWYVESDVVDQSLGDDKSKITIKLYDYQISEEKTLRYAIDHENEKQVALTYNLDIAEIVKPGVHSFEFLLDLDHREIFIDSLNVLPCHHITLRLAFRSTPSLSPMNLNVKKPVIYLYPTDTTDIEVKLNVAGELAFTYPAYNDGWKVQATPDGNISIGEDDYNYLFWESEQKLSPDVIDRNQGFIVSPEQLTVFLEKQLSEFGFTSKEQADFITYWAPSMKSKSFLYIYFLFNEACDEFATLDISPKPQEIARFYMLWTAVDADYEMTIIPQEIPSMNREGFTVLEWGGAEINTFEKTIN